MEDHVYRVIEITGSSQTSIEDAIQAAVTRASRTLRNLRWFEVLQTRGHLEDGKVQHYQVTMKLGFTIEVDDERPVFLRAQHTVQKPQTGRPLLARFWPSILKCCPLECRPERLPHCGTGVSSAHPLS